MDFNLPGFSVHGILWAGILKCVVMPSSKRSFQPRNESHVFCVSCIVSGFLTYWVTWEAQEKALAMPDSLWPQASLSMEFWRQEYWKGSPFSSPGDLSDQGSYPGHCRWSLYHPSHQGSPCVSVGLREQITEIPVNKEIKYSKSPTYESLSCKLSKMWMYIPSVSSMSEIAAFLLSLVADNPSALPSPISSPPLVSNSFCLFTQCLLLYASCCSVLCTFQGTVP